MLICPRSNGFSKAVAGEPSLANITCDGKKIPLVNNTQFLGVSTVSYIHWRGVPQGPGRGRRLKSILEGPCRPTLSDSESKYWGSQAILPPTNTHCKASAFFSLIQPDLEYAASASLPRKAVSQKKRLISTWRRAAQCAAGSGYQDNVASLVIKTVKDSFVRKSLGSASGRDPVPLQPWLCSLSSERHIKTK